ncbi:MAG TPA: 1-deoxy-D-xylulose-5-phosphate reductoisomerase [Acidimicrobiales bacterium]|nr:1-deoxy-D-xylulose-5-phosphate reductoisomerase [Acidimicrobiales bacterium]
MATTLALVGSTGSIGTQAVDVVRATPGRFDVVAIGAATSVDRLAAQAEELRPRVVAIADEGLAPALKARVPAGTEVRAGADALASLAPLADVVLNAVVGFAGLPVTLAALAAGRRLALANKESLIAGAPAVAAVRATPGAEVVPVDSEHCAIHQCLRTGQPEAELARLVLTASGGPFRGRTRDELTAVTVGDALAHPTWSMGPKITIDSSTLMNKGLEVLEAHELFDVGLDRVEVIIHPQSVVHSFVEWSDGATIAQLSQPDMRLPIGYALSYPSRLPVAFGPLDWAGLGALTFEPPDLEAFSCLALAYEAGREGGLAPAWLNAANEVAVQAFLDGRIAWHRIPTVIRATLERYGAPGLAVTADDVYEADRAARGIAALAVERMDG